jgi:hypothetical protein
MPVPSIVEKVHSASAGNTFFIMLVSSLLLNASLQITPLDRFKTTVKSVIGERTRLQ